MNDTLYCRCGGEVRIVRLTPRYLTLGHVSNPKDQHHVVRLAPAARTGAVPAAPTGQPEGSDNRASAVAVVRRTTGPSPDPALVPDASRTPSAGVGHAGSPNPQPRARNRVPSTGARVGDAPGAAAASPRLSVGIAHGREGD